MNYQVGGAQVRTRRFETVVVVGFLVVAMLLLAPTGPARATVEVVTSRVTATDGRVYWVDNHLVRPSVTVAVAGREYLVVWAGSVNASDVAFPDTQVIEHATNPPGPDFLAVIDADRASPDYGKVVNTATVGPLVENEPHHMQYLYHKGDRIFAGGLYSDTTYVFDVSKLPLITLAGVNAPLDTPCSSIPDAYWTLADHTAYGTYMGGADVPGPCTYTNGQVRVSNGYGGSPGAIVHMSPQGATLSEVPAALPTAEDPTRCANYPSIPGHETCANPHGIQAREDLHRVVASDYAEPRNIVLNPMVPFDNNIFRTTVRTFDTTDPNNPALASVTALPDGPRPPVPVGTPLGGVMQVAGKGGMMETTVTNRPEHKGAFVSSMCGGTVYYTPDITADAPQWREVFDDTTAARVVNPGAPPLVGCGGAGWVQTSPDDSFLFHVVIGRTPGTFGPDDPGIPKMAYVLDIASLVAAGTATTCSVDTPAEVLGGGSEADCPHVASVLPVADTTTGGPHWGALDNFVRLPTGMYKETSTVNRIAASNYFVARTGYDGNHKVCMIGVSERGALQLDNAFRDEIQGTPCVDFNRASWPHGPTGPAKPHSELFVVPDAILR